jgi:enoyl-CoA hydratase/carnithine racemase
MTSIEPLPWRAPDPATDHVAIETLRESLKVVRCELDDGVATVVLDRPARRNSWTARMNAEYRAVMASLDGDPRVRVAIVTGAGDTFCVGADSQALSKYAGAGSYDGGGLATDAATPGYGVREEFDADLTWQLGLRLPVIAAVNGACVGVALALVSFCDIRIAVADAKVSAATSRLGLPAEYALSWALPRIVGLTHAADILLTGRVLRSQELDRFGFFNRVCAADELDATVHEYAGWLAAASPASVTIAKRQLYTDLLATDPAASVRLGKRLTGEMMRLPDYQEGIAALMERRPPAFPAPHLSADS